METEHVLLQTVLDRNFRGLVVSDIQSVFFNYV